MNPYQSIAESLDFDKALRELKYNDLIWKRLEDKAVGEAGARFIEYLRLRVEHGSYDPEPAYIIAAPKSTVATRPAALLSIDDRVMFAAIVDVLRTRIESYLLGNDLVLWPRGTSSPKRWQDFEHSVLESDVSYVARADIVGFYEFVDHERLADVVVAATGKRKATDALIHFLRRVMNSQRGLPQGLLPSDALATLYLSNLDFRMAKEGFLYFRHGDDIRVGVKNYDNGRRAVEVLEAELRALRLTLNGEKTRILRTATYKKEVTNFQKELNRTQRDVVTDKLRDVDELLTAIENAGQDQLRWDFFYHERVSLEDAIEILRPTVTPLVVESATKLFLDTVKRRPPGRRTSALASRDFRERLKWSLVQLSASKSVVGLTHVGSLLKSFPDMTEHLCSYLSALAKMNPEDVASQAERAIQNSYRTEWELARIVRVLVQVPERVSAKTLRVLKKTLDAPHERWLAAVEIVKLLAVRRELDRNTLIRFSNTCPPVFQVDLVDAARSMMESADWAEAFVKTAKSNRIHEVVAGWKVPRTTAGNQ